MGHRRTNAIVVVRWWLIIVLTIGSKVVAAHEPEEFWWHPFAMDVDYLTRLNTDSLENALDTMSNPDSVFFAMLDLINRDYITGQYDLSNSRLDYLSQLLRCNELPVHDLDNKLLGTRLLLGERNVMRNMHFGGRIQQELRSYLLADLDSPIKVGALYYYIKLCVRSNISPEYSSINEAIKRAYAAALAMKYWEPLGSLLGWMKMRNFISDQEFLEVYEQLPPRPKSHALLYFPHLEEGDVPISKWRYEEMYRLGGPSNVFGWFRGSIELAHFYINTKQLDSARYYLDESVKASQYLGDVQVDDHLLSIQVLFYTALGDSVSASKYAGKKRTLDSIISLPLLSLQTVLTNQMALDLDESQHQLRQRNQLLVWLLVGMGGVMSLLAIQTLRVIQQRRQLRKTNDDKAMLYGMIAHDLRSPLAALDSVIRQEGIPASAQASIHSYARKLQFLLDDMLKWTFDQRQQLKPQPSSFDLVELVEENHHLLAQVLAEKLIVVQWDMEEEVVMYADREMISTCVRNMLQNAVKHSALGSQITIRCREEDGKAVLEIENEGSLSQRGGRSLGLQLIQSFSRLNNCRFSLEEHEGRAVAQLTGPNQ